MAAAIAAEESRIAARSWAFAVETAMADRLDGNGIFARLSEADFETYIMRLTRNFAEAIRGAR